MLCSLAHCSSMPAMSSCLPRTCGSCAHAQRRSGPLAVLTCAPRACGPRPIISARTHASTHLCALGLHLRAQVARLLLQPLALAALALCLAALLRHLLWHVSQACVLCCGGRAAGLAGTRRRAVHAAAARHAQRAHTAHTCCRRLPISVSSCSRSASERRSFSDASMRSVRSTRMSSTCRTGAGAGAHAHTCEWCARV